MRPGQEHEDGPPIHGNTRLEVIWTALPAVMLVSLCSYAYAVLVDIEEKRPNELVVNVTGVQFAWKYSYPQQGGKPVEANQLYLPRDRPVLFNVRSEDVIHDFWVPAFRMKIDAVPGITTHIRVTPTKLGNYPVVCAELCGLGHSVMRSTAHVVTPAAFERWLRRQQAPPTAGGGDGGEPASGEQLARLGKQVFTGDGTCGACHTLADAGTTGTTGPNLGEAIEGWSDDEIRTAIVDPNADVAAGFPPDVMPQTFEDTLSPDQLDGLVAYLASVSK
jgi:cytochrome c oxidase subunit 2